MKPFIIVLFLAFCFQNLLSYQEKTIDNNNQWGGKTTQTIFKENDKSQDIVIYAEVDNFYQLGVNKILEYYDFDNVLRKAEVHYQLENVTEFKKVTDFFDQNGNKIKIEYLFNAKFSATKGFYKKIVYYAKSGFNQEVVYYNSTLAKRQGYYKSILYKDFTGDVIKIERFNNKNQLLPNY